MDPQIYGPHERGAENKRGRSTGGRLVVRGALMGSTPPSAWVMLFLGFFVSTQWGTALGIDKQEADPLPIFLEPVTNVTVAVGRDASLSCVVDHLGQHKVAWVHLDRQMIVAIHRQVVSRLQRFYVTHDSHKTWTLHVTQVTQKDRGFYMCQVNTTPMISQKGYLQVVVPPNIVDNTSSGSSLLVRERDNVTLRCEAEGVPRPQIRWRREDGEPILTSNGRRDHEIRGETLPLNSVSREHMGAYLCIASNGIPPSVSKRMILEVEFPPQMHVPNQLLGVPPGQEVTLECQIEAHPKPVTYWSHQGSMISNSSRVMSRTTSRKYKYQMILHIRDITISDYGSYLCVAKNSFAETNGSIKLHKIVPPTRPPQSNKNHLFQDKRVSHHSSKIKNGDEFSKDAFRGEERIFDPEKHPRKESPTAFDQTLYEEAGRRTHLDKEKEKRNRNLSMKAMSEFENRGGGSSSVLRSDSFKTTANIACLICLNFLFSVSVWW